MIVASGELRLVKGERVRVDDGAAERSSFEHVVLPHLDAAYSLALYLLRDTQDAEDAVQDAVLRAIRYFDTLRDEREARAWFLAIVRRECYGGRGSVVSRLPTVSYDAAAPVELTDAAASPDEAVQRKMLLERVAAAIAELPERLRDVLVLREVQQCSYQEIAHITGLPIGTVMSRLSRARAQLAAVLGDSVDVGDLS